ncbi:glycoside hydrolase family 65 protein [Herbidospora yilanensis]|uniref:glycoside hydrolase family 65 protein n=1 Tax=Herbidospora yilanensis TaxID=354426 RepID=UPI0007C67C57|nr:glycosyl hydrolase family 65 protein [Herbidospora yilanensis]
MNPWKLVYDGFDPAAEGLREALCTLGNGYFATRGAAPEAAADAVHYPGTYLAGCYDRLTSRIAGRDVTDESSVNAPNWLPLTFATPDSDWFATGDADLLGYRQELDIRHGVLHRALRYRDGHGRCTEVRQRRLVSMADPHLAALETTFTAENWSGTMRVRSALDGRVANRGVRRYRDLRGDHLTGHATGQAGDTTWLRARTRSSEITIALAARVESDEGRGEPVQEPGWIGERYDLLLEPGVPRTIVKTVALATSRDHAIADARSAALRRVRLAPDFAPLLARHRLAWDRLWERARLDLDDLEDTHHLNLHTFHLLQTLSPHSADLDVGVPARGLHGEAYRGHVFWDELFVLPWLNVRFPEISRSALRYRHRRLPEARAAARELGLPGAMFPWQSGSDGREETPLLHLNPRSGHWLPDNSRLQRHVGLAIGYNVWQHYAATGDLEFLAGFGGDLLIETARLAAATARLEPTSGRYEIHGVMGPDEYHDTYPGAARPGLDNNAYTNIMTVWLLSRARETLSLLPRLERDELTARLALTSEELARWEDITRRMRVDFHDGVISQFTGYADLPELDWERYRGVRRLDRALESVGDSPTRYRAAKQADVLMLFYLLTAEQLREILDRLGYEPPPEMIQDTVAYYLDRTCHGSTLSAVVHAWVLSRSDRTRSWRFFAEALGSDLADVQRGTTAEGIHLGAMAGTLDLVQRCYLGLEVHHGELHLNPLLPDRFTLLSLPIRVRGATVSIDIDHDKARISRADDGPAHLSVTVQGQSVLLRRMCHRVFSLRARRGETTGPPDG